MLNVYRTIIGIHRANPSCHVFLLALYFEGQGVGVKTRPYETRHHSIPIARPPSCHVVDRAANVYSLPT